MSRLYFNNNGNVRVGWDDPTKLIKNMQKLGRTGSQTQAFATKLLQTVPEHKAVFLTLINNANAYDSKYKLLRVFIDATIRAQKLEVRSMQADLVPASNVQYFLIETTKHIFENIAVDARKDNTRVLQNLKQNARSLLRIVCNQGLLELDLPIVYTTPTPPPAPFDPYAAYTNYANRYGYATTTTAADIDAQKRLSEIRAMVNQIARTL